MRLDAPSWEKRLSAGFEEAAWVERGWDFSGEP